MRTISLAKAQPGMELARDLVDFEGNLLLEKGIKLTDRYIKRLSLLGIPALYITDPLLEDLDDRFLIPAALHRETLACLSTIFRSQVSEILTSVRKREAHIRRLHLSVDRIVTEVANHREHMVNLNIFNHGNSIANHSINVCLLAIVIGLASNLSQTGVKELALGALLHDIGKLCIPDHILNKSDPLTQAEMALLRKHSFYGYELVKLSDEVPHAAALAVLHHHERYGGNGYPAALQGENIHPYGRICAIADVFEAMTADRIYRHAISRKDAIETMVSASDRDFDLHHLQAFLISMAVYPVGTKIKLNTGEIAFVIRNNPKAVLRPIVRVTTNPHGQPLHAPFELDLLSHTDVTISSINYQE